MPMPKEHRDAYNEHKKAERKAAKIHTVLKARKVGTTEWTHTYTNATQASKDKDIDLSLATIRRIIKGQTKNPKKWEFIEEIIPNDFKYNKTWDEVRKEKGLVNKSEVEKPLRIEHEFMDGVECKWCGKCKQYLPLDCFMESPVSVDGLKFKCTLCCEYEPEEEEPEEEEFVFAPLNRTPSQERLYQAWLVAKQEYDEKYKDWCKTKDHTVEVFVPVMKCPGYVISNWGNLISYRQVTHGRQLTQRDKKNTRHGVTYTYKQYRILSDVYRKYVAPSVHVLVAKHFLDDYSPKKQVDHMDRDKLNNHVTNLRMVTNSQNKHNTGVYKNNKLKTRGVCPEVRDGKMRYRWYVNIDGDQIAHGRKDDKDDAIEIRRQWIFANIVPDQQQFFLN